MLTNLYRPTIQRPLVIGISGGSGSGKTTFALGLKRWIGDHRVGILSQDSYYRDLSKIFDRDGGTVNFDHPESVEFELMSEHLRLLKQGEGVEVPIYDFTSHSRRPASLMFQPRPIVLIEGILLFTQPQILERTDMLVFIETPEQVRFERRLARDVTERGRTPEGVKEQFEQQVKPMHNRFVQPSQTVAHKVVSGEQSFETAFKEISDRITFEEVRLEVVV